MSCQEFAYSLEVEGYLGADHLQPFEKAIYRLGYGCPELQALKQLVELPSQQPLGI